MLIDPAVVRTMQVDALAAELIRTFERAGVETILLKGSAIADIYPDRNRTYMDVDLLVAPEALTTAASMLRDLGFRPMAQHTSRHEERPHATTWTRPGSPCVDLHESLWGVHAPPEALWPALSQGAESHLVAGQPCRRLDMAGRALHLALHAIQSGRKNSRCLEDLERGLSSLPPAAWGAAAELARHLKAETAFCAGLSLSKHGQALAEVLCPECGALPLILAMRAESATSAAHGVASLAGTPGWWSKMTYTVHRCFPSVPVLREVEPVARAHLIMAPVGYLVRFVRLTWRLGPAVRDVRDIRRALGSASPDHAARELFFQAGETDTDV